MRLFLAIEFHNPIFKNAQGLLQPAGSFSFPDSFHLTLKFLGEVDTKKVPAIVEHVRRVQWKPFALHVGAIGFFPRPKDPRVVWMGTTPEEECKVLQRDIDKALENFFEKDHRFKPHVTIARVKTIHDFEMLQKIAEKISRMDGFDVIVDKFHLIESDLSKGKPQYTIRESFA
jgi:2'-5' RNA ligase